MLALYELVLFENCYKISLIVDSYGIPNSIYVDSGKESMILSLVAVRSRRDLTTKEILMMQKWARIFLKIQPNYLF